MTINTGKTIPAMGAMSRSCITWNRFRTTLLREMDWGIYTGETLEDVDWEHLPPGVESVDELYHRAGEFVNYLRVKYAGKCILAVGHGAFNRAILTYLNGGKPADMVDLPIMENTSVIRLSI